MSSELLNIISTGGAGVAVTVVTVIFLRFLREERKELMSDRRVERREFLRALSELSVRLETLTERIGESFRPSKHREPQLTVQQPTEYPNAQNSNDPNGKQ